MKHIVTISEEGDASEDYLVNTFLKLINVIHKLVTSPIKFPMRVDTGQCNHHHHHYHHHIPDPRKGFNRWRKCQIQFKHLADYVTNHNALNRIISTKHENCFLLIFFKLGAQFVFWIWWMNFFQISWTKVFIHNYHSSTYWVITAISARRILGCVVA